MYYIYEYERLAYQLNQSYFEETRCDGNFIGDFDTLESALAALKEFDAWEDEPHVITTRRGLDSVSYRAVELTVDVIEDGEVVEVEYIDGRDNVPPTWRRAMMIHEHEYHAFLDFQRDHYRSLNDILGREE